MKRLLLMSALLAASLVACIPTANQAPAAQRYAAPFDTAVSNTVSAMRSLEGNGYGPYSVDTGRQANGVITASWTSGANVTYSITANIRSIDASTSEVAIQGSTTNPDQSTYTAVLYLYGELDAMMQRLE